MYILVLKPGKHCNDLNAKNQEFESRADALTYLQMNDLINYYDIKEKK